MMRSGDSDYVRPMLAIIGLPKKGVGVLDAPFSGRLKRFDIEVEMRPTATAPFLAQHTEFVTGLDRFTWMDRRVDRIKMRIAIVPPAGVENIDVIVIAMRFVEGCVFL